MVKKKKTASSSTTRKKAEGAIVFAKTEPLSKSYATVDFPQEGEIVTTPTFTVRVSTSASEGVEISIDGKEARPCRESVGLWWYDWSGYGSGPHSIVARIMVGKRAVKSKPRSFTVLI